MIKTNLFTWRMTRDAVLGTLAIATSIPLTVPSASPESLLFAKIGITALLILIAFQDLRTQTVSPFITMAWMGMSIVRSIIERDASFLLFWSVIFLLWSLHFYGGGDAKLLMGLFGLMPDIRLLWIISIVLVVTGIPFLAHKYWHTPPRVLASGLSRRIQSRGFLPSDEELDQGVPFAFAYCIAGTVYLWIFV